MTKIRKHSSKRSTLRKQYSVAKKVRDHKKKIKKEIRKMKKDGVQKPTIKTPGIPNSHPEKAKMLDELEYKDKLESEARATMIALKKAHKAMPNGVMESFAQPFQAEVIKEDQSNVGKLSAAEIALAEKLMEITGEIDPNARKDLGPSRRAFYKECKKVVEASDVILQVLDARDPDGCRSDYFEKEAQKLGKKLIQVINKVDLVPSQNSRQWQRHLSGEFPVVLFNANYQGPSTNKSKEIKENRKKGDVANLDPNEKMIEHLMKILRNTARVTKTDDKPVLIVGVVGFPNVGKSSIINALRKSNSCVVSTSPGTTKSLQEVQIHKTIVALDSPGVIPNTVEQLNGLVLCQAIKCDELEDVIGPVETLLSKVQQDEILKLYHIAQYKTTDQMLQQLAKKKAALRVGGKANVEDAARTVLRDFLNGKIKYFTPPPVTALGSNDSDEEMN